MPRNCTIEISLAGQWQGAAELSVAADPLLGHERTPVRFSYDLDYAFVHLGRQDAAALSLRYPVDLADHHLPTWPSFLLDLLPTGAGRRRLCLTLGLPDTASADWDLLRQAGGPPPGNLRIGPRQTPPIARTRPGFHRQEVMQRAEGFIEHCLLNGCPVGGSSAVQGESPKALLSEDVNGRFHPSGTLPDNQVACEWLVKFPRGRTAIDRHILRAEATYYEVARRLGCHTAAPLTWESDCLFVPRFDIRSAAGKLHRMGLETMASAIGKTGFGEPVGLDEFATAIRQFSSAPIADLLELLRRDVLNVALGNTDNHARNTSFIKGTNVVRLAPLYDFAPMMVDPEWIARACRWPKQEEAAGYPRWRQLARQLSANADEEKTFHQELDRLRHQLPEIPAWLHQAGIDKQILARCEERCRRVGEDLAEHETHD